MTQTRTIELGAYTFDEKAHLHTLDGKPLTGVTTVLGVLAKPALIQWSANEAVKFVQENIKTCFDTEGKFVEIAFSQTCLDAKTAHRKKKEKAGDIGSKVHDAIECMIKGNPMPDLDEQGQKMFLNFSKWAEDNKVKFLDSERHVYSKTHWIGGICDLVIELEGKIYIGDIKTSSGIYPENFFQTSAYQMCLQEMGEHLNIEGHIIINLKKTGEIDVKKSYGYEQNKEAFLACLTLYRALNTINNTL